jgi:hypothetical protein
VFDQPQARANLTAQAEAAGRAILHADHQKMADLTHPAVIAHFGGREKFAQMLESMAADMKGQGFGFAKITMGEPSALFEAAGEVYGVVPYQLEMTGPGRASGRKPSALIAVSRDRGTNWTFIDGQGVGGPEQAEGAAPEFPSAVGGARPTTGRLG